jgi:hypothetical protein
MQNRLIFIFDFDLNIQNVHQYIEIELNVLVSDDKTEFVERFFMNLTMMTKFDEMLNKVTINVVVFRSFEYLM